MWVLDKEKNHFISRFTVSLIYYGLAFNAGSLVGDLYLNSLLLGVVEIPANVVCRFMVNRFGRRFTNAFGLLVAGVGSFVCIPLVGNKGWSRYGFCVVILNI